MAASLVHILQEVKNEVEKRTLFTAEAKMHSTLMKLQKSPLAMHKPHHRNRSCDHTPAALRRYTFGHPTADGFLVNAFTECAFSILLEICKTHILATIEAPNLLHDYI